MIANELYNGVRGRKEQALLVFKGGAFCKAGNEPDEPTSVKDGGGNFNQQINHKPKTLRL